MKALKDCKWEVTISKGTLRFFWYAWIEQNAGMDNFESDKYFNTKVRAKQHFEKFAKLNGITNYKIVE